MSKVNHKFIGGSLDGETHKVDPKREWIQMTVPTEIYQSVSEIIDSEISNEEGMEFNVETYKVWDLTFVDQHKKKHQYHICYHKDLSDAEAFHKLIANY